MASTELRTGDEVDVRPGGVHLKNSDVFAAVNALLFVFMCVTVYYRRFVTHGGIGNITEFFIYACAILSAIALAAVFLRRFDWPGWILAMVQIGILAHFTGAFVPVDGGRLYDAYILGVRYDKFVHFYNAFAGCCVVGSVFARSQARLPARGFIILMVVLGAGSVVEMMEYVVASTVPQSGVGDYDNNMQDLISNLAGALFYLVSIMASPWLRARAWARGGG